VNVLAGLQGAVSEAGVREHLERVLAREEFQWDRESLAERVIRWLGDTVHLPGLPALPGGLQLLLSVLIAALAVALVTRVLRPWLAATAPASGAQAAGGDPVGDRVRRYLERARAARAAGELKSALRLYFFALVVGLGRRGELEYRDTWTNRELLDRGHPTPEVRALLDPLVDDLDRKGFGGAPASAADVDYLADLCARRLAAEGAAS